MLRIYIAYIATGYFNQRTYQWEPALETVSVSGETEKGFAEDPADGSQGDAAVVCSEDDIDTTTGVLKIQVWGYSKGASTLRRNSNSDTFLGLFCVVFFPLD